MRGARGTLALLLFVACCAGALASTPRPTCTNLVPNGELCAPTDLCGGAPTHTCYQTMGGDAPRCNPVVGAQCTSNADCVDGIAACIDGHCAPFRGPYEPCGADNECFSNLCDIGCQPFTEGDLCDPTKPYQCDPSTFCHPHTGVCTTQRRIGDICNGPPPATFGGNVTWWEECDYGVCDAKTHRCIGLWEGEEGTPCALDMPLTCDANLVCDAHSWECKVANVTIATDCWDDAGCPAGSRCMCFPPGGGDPKCLRAHTLDTPPCADVMTSSYYWAVRPAQWLGMIGVSNTSTFREPERRHAVDALHMCLDTHQFTPTDVLYTFAVAGDQLAFNGMVGAEPTLAVPGVHYLGIRVADGMPDQFELQYLNGTTFTAPEVSVIAGSVLILNLDDAFTPTSLLLASKVHPSLHGTLHFRRDVVVGGFTGHWHDAHEDVYLCADPTYHFLLGHVINDGLLLGSSVPDSDGAPILWYYVDPFEPEHDKVIVPDLQDDTTLTLSVFDLLGYFLRHEPLHEWQLARVDGVMHTDDCVSIDNVLAFTSSFTGVWQGGPDGVIAMVLKAHEASGTNNNQDSAEGRVTGTMVVLNSEGTQVEQSAPFFGRLPVGAIETIGFLEHNNTDAGMWVRLTAPDSLSFSIVPLGTPHTPDTTTNVFEAARTDTQPVWLEDWMERGNAVFGLAGTWELALGESLPSITNNESAEGQQLELCVVPHADGIAVQGWVGLSMLFLADVPAAPIVQNFADVHVQASAFWFGDTLERTVEVAMINETTILVTAADPSTGAAVSAHFNHAQPGNNIVACGAQTEAHTDVPFRGHFRMVREDLDKRVEDPYVSGLDVYLCEEVPSNDTDPNDRYLYGVERRDDKLHPVTLEYRVDNGVFWFATYDPSDEPRIVRLGIGKRPDAFRGTGFVAATWEQPEGHSHNNPFHFVPPTRGSVFVQTDSFVPQEQCSMPTPPSANNTGTAGTVSVYGVESDDIVYVASDTVVSLSWMGFSFTEPGTGDGVDFYEVGVSLSDNVAQSVFPAVQVDNDVGAFVLDVNATFDASFVPGTHYWAYVCAAPIVRTTDRVCAVAAEAFVYESPDVTLYVTNVNDGTQAPHDVGQWDLHHLLAFHPTVVSSTENVQLQYALITSEQQVVNDALPRAALNRENDDVYRVNVAMSDVGNFDFHHAHYAHLPRCNATQSLTLTDYSGFFGTSAPHHMIPAEAQCMWTLAPPATGNCVTMVIEAEALRPSDLIVVRDGGGNEIASLTQWSDFTTPITTATGNMTVSFAASAAESTPGFHARYFVEPCPVTNQAGHVGFTLSDSFYAVYVEASVTAGGVEKKAHATSSGVRVGPKTDFFSNPVGDGIPLNDHTTIHFQAEALLPYDHTIAFTWEEWDHTATGAAAPAGYEEWWGWSGQVSSSEVGARALPTYGETSVMLVVPVLDAHTPEDDEGIFRLNTTSNTWEPWRCDGVYGAATTYGPLTINQESCSIGGYYATFRRPRGHDTVVRVHGAVLENIHMRTFVGVGHAYNVTWDFGTTEVEWFTLSYAPNGIVDSFAQSPYLIYYDFSVAAVEPVRVCAHLAHGRQVCHESASLYVQDVPTWSDARVGTQSRSIQHQYSDHDVHFRLFPDMRAYGFYTETRWDVRAVDAPPPAFGEMSLLDGARYYSQDEGQNGVLMRRSTLLTRGNEYAVYVALQNVAGVYRVRAGTLTIDFDELVCDGHVNHVEAVANAHPLVVMEMTSSGVQGLATSLWVQPARNVTGAPPLPPTHMPLGVSATLLFAAITPEAYRVDTSLALAQVDVPEKAIAKTIELWRVRDDNTRWEPASLACPGYQGPDVVNGVAHSPLCTTPGRASPGLTAWVAEVAGAGVVTLENVVRDSTPGSDLVFSADAHVVLFSWHGFSHTHHLTGYVARLMRVNNETTVVSSGMIAPGMQQFQFHFGGAGLADGRYFVEVCALYDHSRTCTDSSHVLVVDTTPPVVSVLHDGHQSRDVDTQDSFGLQFRYRCTDDSGYGAFGVMHEGYAMSPVHGGSGHELFTSFDAAEEGTYTIPNSYVGDPTWYIGLRCTSPGGTTERWTNGVRYGPQRLWIDPAANNYQVTRVAAYDVHMIVNGTTLGHAVEGNVTRHHVSEAEAAAVPTGMHVVGDMSFVWGVHEADPEATVEILVDVPLSETDVHVFDLTTLQLHAFDTDAAKWVPAASACAATGGVQHMVDGRNVLHDRVCSLSPPRVFAMLGTPQNGSAPHALGGALYAENVVGSVLFEDGVELVWRGFVPSPLAHFTWATAHVVSASGATTHFDVPLEGDGTHGRYWIPFAFEYGEKYWFTLFVGDSAHEAASATSPRYVAYTTRPRVERVDDGRVAGLDLAVQSSPTLLHCVATLEREVVYTLITNIFIGVSDAHGMPETVQWVSASSSSVVNRTVVVEHSFATPLPTHSRCHINVTTRAGWAAGASNGIEVNAAMDQRAVLAGVASAWTSTLTRNHTIPVSARFTPAESQVVTLALRDPTGRADPFHTDLPRHYSSLDGVVVDVEAMAPSADNPILLSMDLTSVSDALSDESLLHLVQWVDGHYVLDTNVLCGPPSVSGHVLSQEICVDGNVTLGVFREARLPPVVGGVVEYVGGVVDPHRHMVFFGSFDVGVHWTSFHFDPNNPIHKFELFVKRGDAVLYTETFAYSVDHTTLDTSGYAEEGQMLHVVVCAHAQEVLCVATPDPFLLDLSPPAISYIGLSHTDDNPYVSVTKLSRFDPIIMLLWEAWTRVSFVESCLYAVGPANEVRPDFDAFVPVENVRQGSEVVNMRDLHAPMDTPLVMWLAAKSVGGVTYNSTAPFVIGNRTQAILNSFVRYDVQHLALPHTTVGVNVHTWDIPATARANVWTTPRAARYQPPAGSPHVVLPHSDVRMVSKSTREWTYVPETPVSYLQTAAWIIKPASGGEFTSQGMGGVARVHADPDPDEPTLELEMMHFSVPMRMFFYFSHNETHWWASEVRTYDGSNQGEWLFYDGPLWVTPLGHAQVCDYGKLVSEDGRSTLELFGMTLQAVDITEDKAPACAYPCGELGPADVRMSWAASDIPPTVNPHRISALRSLDGGVYERVPATVQDGVVRVHPSLFHGVQDFVLVGEHRVAPTAGTVVVAEQVSRATVGYDYPFPNYIRTGGYVSFSWNSFEPAPGHAIAHFTVGLGTQHGDPTSNDVYESIAVPAHVSSLRINTTLPDGTALFINLCAVGDNGETGCAQQAFFVDSSGGPHVSSAKMGSQADYVMTQQASTTRVRFHLEWFSHSPTADGLVSVAVTEHDYGAPMPPASDFVVAHMAPSKACPLCDPVALIGYADMPAPLPTGAFHLWVAVTNAGGTGYQESSVITVTGRDELLLDLASVNDAAVADVRFGGVPSLLGVQPSEPLNVDVTVSATTLNVHTVGDVPYNAVAHPPAGYESVQDVLFAVEQIDNNVAVDTTLLVQPGLLRPFNTTLYDVTTLGLACMSATGTTWSDVRTAGSSGAIGFKFPFALSTCRYAALFAKPSALHPLPHVGTVTVTSTAREPCPAARQADNRHVRLLWEDFTDETGIVTYTVCVSSESESFTCAFPPMQFGADGQGAEQAYNVDDTPLADHVPYYMVVCARNTLGGVACAQSASFQVDSATFADVQVVDGWQFEDVALMDGDEWLFSVQTDHLDSVCKVEAMVSDEAHPAVGAQFSSVVCRAGHQCSVAFGAPPTARVTYYVHVRLQTLRGFTYRSSDGAVYGSEHELVLPAHEEAVVDAEYRGTPITLTIEEDALDEPARLSLGDADTSPDVDPQQHAPHGLASVAGLSFSLSPVARDGAHMEEVTFRQPLALRMDVRDVDSIDEFDATSLRLFFYDTRQGEYVDLASTCATPHTEYAGGFLTVHVCRLSASTLADDVMRRQADPPSPLVTTIALFGRKAPKPSPTPTPTSTPTPTPGPKDTGGGNSTLDVALGATGAVAAVLLLLVGYLWHRSRTGAQRQMKALLLEGVELREAEEGGRFLLVPRSGGGGGSGGSGGGDAPLLANDTTGGSGAV